MLISLLVGISCALFIGTAISIWYGWANIKRYLTHWWEDYSPIIYICFILGFFAFGGWLYGAQPVSFEIPGGIITCDTTGEHPHTYSIWGENPEELFNQLHSISEQCPGVY